MYSGTPEPNQWSERLLSLRVISDDTCDDNYTGNKYLLTGLLGHAAAGIRISVSLFHIYFITVHKNYSH